MKHAKHFLIGGGILIAIVFNQFSFSDQGIQRIYRVSSFEKSVSLAHKASLTDNLNICHQIKRGWFISVAGMGLGPAEFEYRDRCYYTYAFKARDASACLFAKHNSDPQRNSCFMEVSFLTRKGMGDANKDGRVNIEDFTILKNSLKSRKGDQQYDARADFTLDGLVNNSDYQALKYNFTEGEAPPLDS